MDNGRSPKAPPAATVRVHGRPGDWARIRGLVVPLWPLPACAFAGGFLIAAALFAGGAAGFAAAVAFAGTALAAAWTWRRGISRCETYFKGARGEETVAAALAAMPGPGCVFHDFRAGPLLCIDHLALLPGGAFAIETKNWAGPVALENGRLSTGGAAPSRDPLAQTVRQAAAAEKALRKAGWTGGVQGVLCFASDAWRGPEGAQTGGAAVVNVSALAGWLASRPQTCGTGEIERIAGILEAQE